jgi:hypothetical protein
MFTKVIRRTRRPKVTIRYVASGQPPATADASAPPPWHGQRVKIEDLASFAARWGLLAVRGEWPAGDPCPRLYMVETSKGFRTLGGLVRCAGR